MEEKENKKKAVTQEENIEASGKAEVEQIGLSASLADIFSMICKHIIAIIAAAIIGLGCGFSYAKIFNTTTYYSTAMMLVLGRQVDASGSYTTDSKYRASLAANYMQGDDVAMLVTQKLVDEYKYSEFLKDGIYQEATVKSLYSASVQSSSSSFVLISCNFKQEQLSIDVVNCVSDITVELCNQEGTFGYYNLNGCITASGHSTSATASSSLSMSKCTLAGLGIGALVGLAYAILREVFFSNKVGSQYDLEVLTGYRVIGMIPEGEKKK